MRDSLRVGLSMLLSVVLSLILVLGIRWKIEADALQSEGNRAADRVEQFLQSVVSSLSQFDLNDVPCSKRDIELLRSMVVFGTGIVEAGVVVDGILVCTSWGTAEYRSSLRSNASRAPRAPRAASVRRVLRSQLLKADVLVVTIDGALGSATNALILTQHIADLLRMSSVQETAFLESADEIIAGKKPPHWEKVTTHDLAAVAGLRVGHRARPDLKFDAALGVSVLAIIVCVAILMVSRIFPKRRHQELKILESLTTGRITVQFQPIVEAASGRCVGFEALSRWFHPVKGLLCPGEFLPLLRSAEGRARFDRFYLGESAAAVARFSAISSAVYVSVNISAEQLRSPTFIGDVKHAISQSNVNISNLRFEILEGEHIALDDHAIATLQSLVGIGGRLVIDDFGAGESSFVLLQHLPIECVKIDRRLVTGAARTLKGEKLLAATCQLCRHLGVKIVAEGVETHGDLQCVANAGADFCQGFLFSKAIPLEAAAGLLCSSVSADVAPHEGWVLHPLEI